MSVPRWVWAVLIGSLLATAIGVWLYRSIEWYDADVPAVPTEPFNRERFHAAKLLLRKLGATAETPQNFEKLPPAGATLVLTSRYWALIPERVLALDRWVRAGGRLVIFQNGGTDDARAGWVPIRSVKPPPKHPPAAASAAGPGASDDADDDDDDDDDTPSFPAPTPAPAASGVPLPADKDGDRGCKTLREPDSAHAAYATRRDYRVCGYAPRRLRTSAPVTWSLELPDGAAVLRVAHGQGSVTSSALVSFINDNVLEHDGPLAFAAMLSVHAGDVVWFVVDEKRTPFLARLWQSGSPALLLALLALGLALWRGGTRFGPPTTEPAGARRSISEQVRRTAAFIAHGGGAALHRASARALEEAARRWLPGYGALLSANERGRAIAAATGIDAAVLASALVAGTGSASDQAGARRHIGASIAVLEQARRQLLSMKTPP